MSLPERIALTTPTKLKFDKVVAEMKLKYSKKLTQDEVIDQLCNNFLRILKKKEAK